MNWLWLVLPFLILVAGGALWLAASRPGFWIGVVKAIAADMRPSLSKLFRPSRLTPKEREEIERDRQWHRGGGRNG
jgi:hypothetical protein